MAVAIQHVVTLNEPGGTLTLDVAFDSIMLLVTSITVTNNLGHPYTFTVTNTNNPLQTFTRTLPIGPTVVDLVALNLPWPLNADASLADGWVFNG
jgi:hypothetical protein